MGEVYGVGCTVHVGFHHVTKAPRYLSTGMAVMFLVQVEVQVPILVEGRIGFVRGREGKTEGRRLIFVFGGGDNSGGGDGGMFIAKMVVGG